MVTKVWKL